MQRWEFTGRLWPFEGDLPHPELTVKDRLNEFGRHGWQVAAVDVFPTDEGPRMMVLFQRPVADEEPNAGDL